MEWCKKKIEQYFFVSFLFFLSFAPSHIIFFLFHANLAYLFQMAQVYEPYD